MLLLDNLLVRVHGIRRSGTKVPNTRPSEISIPSAMAQAVQTVGTAMKAHHDKGHRQNNNRPDEFISRRVHSMNRLCNSLGGMLRRTVLE